jgi:hypothetical protein
MAAPLGSFTIPSKPAVVSCPDAMRGKNTNATKSRCSERRDARAAKRYALRNIMSKPSRKNAHPGKKQTAFKAALCRVNFRTQKRIQFSR